MNSPRLFPALLRHQHQPGYGDFSHLRMWFNLAWFEPEFQLGEVTLLDGTAGDTTLIDCGEEWRWQLKQQSLERGGPA
ncbi:MAG: hypothetical protein ACKV19_15260 [Verrucomicrobiales bacterium]